MADWHLAFIHPQSVMIEACERLFSGFVGGPVTLKVGEPEGNPRDYIFRVITLRGQQNDIRLSLTTDQGMRSLDDLVPTTNRVGVTLASTTATFAEKREMWRALHDAFATIGFLEATFNIGGGSAIADDAEAAGDSATAAHLREEISAAQASILRGVGISSPPTDIESILAVYREPERISALSLSDCGPSALPVCFARFPNIEDLYLREDAFDGSALRGVLLPRLRLLSLRGKALYRLEKADLAGFPLLEVLSLADNALEALDPDIIEACPKLVRVYVQDTPLFANQHAMDKLRARWRGMEWSQLKIT